MRVASSPRKSVVLSLRPYPGTVHICWTRKQYKAKHVELFGEKDAGFAKAVAGRFSGKVFDDAVKDTYLVFASNTPALAHELTHCLLHTFQKVGIEPAAGGGEPFCYMLSQLLTEAQP